MKFHPCSSLSSNKITLSLSIVLLFLDSFCKSAITGPIDSLDTIRLSGEKSDAPIRLVEKGGRGGSRAYNHNSIQPPVKNRSSQQKQRQNTYIQEMEQEEQSQQQQRRHQQQQQHHHQQQQRVLQQETQTPTEQNETKNTNAKLNILEPPMDSILAGSNFKVSVQVLAENQDDFTDAYEKSSDGKICISLDDSPFHCGWSAIDGNIFFSNAIEGSHTIVAMLYNNGTLHNESRSETISFTTVQNPDIDSDDDDEDSSLSLDGISNQKVKNSSNGEVVNVKVPTVQIDSPADKVTYPGTSVTIRNIVDPPEPELFERYFKHSFICINIDAATAHSCFAAFGDTNPPFVIGLDPGLHSIEAALSHPESGDLLFQTSSSTKIFYVAGELNEAAYIVGEAAVDGATRFIPVAKGGSLSAQADGFCSSIGLKEDISCTGSVFHHLSKAWRAKELGFVSS